MSEGSYRKAYVKCPFYRMDVGPGKKNSGFWHYRISCEGFTDDCIVSATFRSGKELLQHMQLFCEDHYSCCELYRATYGAKYAGED